MTGKNLRFRVDVSYPHGGDSYIDLTSDKVIDIIREVDDYYRFLTIYIKMNDGEWLDIFNVDSHDLTDEDESNECVFTDQWVNCDLDDRGSWDPEFVKKINEHGGFKNYPTKN